MSTWYEPKKEDLSISEDGKELHIYIDSDYNGSIRVSVNVEDIREIINKYKQ